MKNLGRKTIALGVSVGVAAALFSVPAAAYADPTGEFTSVELQKTQDGYTFTNNPVDSDPDNGIVAVNDYVGFKIDAVTGSDAVTDARIRITKPACWAWHDEIDLSLTFVADQGETQASVSHPNPNTIVVDWNQADLRRLTTPEFKVRAGFGCENGSTWAPTITYTDGSGTHSQTLDVVTVRSVSQADLSMTRIGGPQVVGNVDFGTVIGTTAAMRQEWQLRLAPAPGAVSGVGYGEASGGRISFTVSFASQPGQYALRSQFQFPRPGGVSGCWTYEDPTVNNNNQLAPTPASQTVTITMVRSNNPNCEGLLTQGNTIRFLSLTPIEFVPETGTRPLIATAAPLDWTDRFGNEIEEVNGGNNSARVNMGLGGDVDPEPPSPSELIRNDLFAPRPGIVNADYTQAWPRLYDNPPSIGIRPAYRSKWSKVTGQQVGVDAQLVSSAFYRYASNPIRNLSSYHLFLPSRLRLDVARLDQAVFGPVAPNNDAAASDPAADTRVFDTSEYTVTCTRGHNGSNGSQTNQWNWQNCANIDPSEISGVRFQYPGQYSGADFSPYATGVKRLFSQVPLIAVGAPGQEAKVSTKWWAPGRGSASRVVRAYIAGHLLALTKKADVAQVHALGEVTYTLNPRVKQPPGSHEPRPVTNLKIVDRLDIGVEDIDLSAVHPFWHVERVNADYGPDGVPYTADDVHGPRLTFTPNGSVTTHTFLPDIEYTIGMGVLLPPGPDPHVTNVAWLSADDTPGAVMARADVDARAPTVSSLSKSLVSDSVIELNDDTIEWRLNWVNFNDEELGSSVLVDVFPWNGDSRVNGAESDFDGSVRLAAISRHGSAALPGTTYEVTTDAPGTISAAPAASTSWVAIDPDDPSGWPANATALRVTLPAVQEGYQTTGSAELTFTVQGHRPGNVYGNDVSGVIVDEDGNITRNLGTDPGDSVNVVTSSIHGLVWLDRNMDGIRQNDEPRLPGVDVSIYRNGSAMAQRTATTGADGTYDFRNLSSADYQVVFDHAQVTSLGYAFTTPNAGADPTFNSLADVDSGEVPSFELPIQSQRTHVNAGLVALRPSAEITGDASLTRTFGWEIEKSLTNADSLVVDPSTGAVEAEYEIVTTDGEFSDSDIQFDGTVTVTNPSPVQTFTVTTTVAADGSGLSCVVVDGVDRAIAPAATLELEYECTGSPGMDLFRALTATITTADVDPIAGEPLDLSEATADVNYEVTSVNRTVNVEDSAVIDGVDQPVESFGPYDWTAAGETRVESYTVELTVDAGDCLAVENTAEIMETGQSSSTAWNACLPLDPTIEQDMSLSMSRGYGWDIEKTLLNPNAAPDADGNVELDYEVEVTEGPEGDSNWELSGELTVSNPNLYKSIDIELDQSINIGGGVSCVVAGGTSLTLDAGETRVLSYGCTFTSQPVYSGENAWEMSWQTDLPGTSQDLVETRSASADEVFVEADWTLIESVKNVSVTDTMTIGDEDPVVRSFGPYEWDSTDSTDVYTESYTVDVTVPAGDCLAVENTAEIMESGQSDTSAWNACLPLDPTIDRVTMTSLQRTYGWEIEKNLLNPGVALDGDGAATLEYEVVVTEGAATDANWTMSGEVTVSNPNLYKSIDIEMEHLSDLGGGMDCVYAGGPSFTLAAGETQTLHVDCTFDSQPSYDGEVSAEMSWETDLPGTSRDLVESRSASAEEQIVEADWSLTEFEDEVSVVDSMVIDGEAQPVRSIGPFEQQAEGTVHRTSYDVDIQVDPGTCVLVENTAEIVELGSQQTTQHELCRMEPLSVSDAVTASYVNTYSWDIALQLMNRAELEGDDAPSNAEAEYQTTVTQGDFVSSAHQLRGQIEITNPNDFQSFTVDLSNAISAAGVDCQLSETDDLLIPAGGTVTVTYECTGDLGSADLATHAVTMTGDEIDTLTENTEVVFDVTHVDGTITVTDSQHEYDPQWTITWSGVGVQDVRSYSLPVHTAAGECQVVENVATILQTGQQSVESFRICVPNADTGGGPGLPITGIISSAPLILFVAVLMLLGIIVLLIERRRRAERETD